MDTAVATVARLRATFATRRTRSVEWRLGQLRALERLLAERESEIAAALAADLGRSAFQAFLGDVASTKAEVVFAQKHLPKWVRPKRTGVPISMRPGRAWYQHEPLGVVLIIGPWNYPVYLTLSPLVGAIAAGNCAVIKPSEHAPESSRLLARLVPEYLDTEAFVVVEGDAEVTQELLAQGLDHALFTGGIEVGKKVMAAAASHLTPVTLELGGKSPVIVTPDADLEVAARRIALAKFSNSGQVCIAPDYVLVDCSVQDELVKRLVETVQAFQRDEVDPGRRIVNRRQFDRLSELIEQTDGEIVLGGKAYAESVAIEPTVIVDPSPDSPEMQEEIFGPILPVLGVGSLDDAIRFVNDRPKPLAAYLFSRSRDERTRVVREISAGGMVVNHIGLHCLVPQLPFGGVGNSGMGAYHGRWGFETFSHRKAVLSMRSRPDPAVMYPPYTDRKQKLIRKFL